MTAKCFKPLYGFCTCLSEDLDRDDCALGLPDKYSAKLRQLLGNGFYTYLVISDGFCHEIIKVECSQGILYIERAQDHTSKENWTCGDRVKFDWTLSGICDLKKVAEEEDEECPVELFTGEIKNGNCTVKFEDGIAVKNVPNKHQISDGCYDVPVVTYKDGCLVAIAEGSREVSYVSCDNGHCPKCK